MTRVSDFYYGWSAAAADINKDGVLDIVSGPFYYLGPSYTERRSYRESRVYNPGVEYAGDMVNYSGTTSPAMAGRTSSHRNSRRGVRWRPFLRQSQR